MSRGASEGSRFASALAALRRVRRRLEREASREAAFLETPVRRARRTPPERGLGSSSLPLPGNREVR